MVSTRSIALMLAAVAACDAGDSGDGALAPVDAGAPVLDAGPEPVRALYTLRAGTLPFGSVPWPDDAYLDDRGRVAVRDLPTSADPVYADQLTAALSDVDGFGLRPVVYVRFDGAIDGTTLPADPEASLQPEASVFLLDADTSSPTAFERIPIDVRYVAASFELRLRPAFGRSLVPGRRYAAVVTDRLHGENGEPVAPAERFASIRDRPILGTSLERAARARYNPVLQTLALEGLARRRVVALAVFHVQSARGDLDAARALLGDQPMEPPVLTLTKAGPELDLLLGSDLRVGAVGVQANGVPHDQVGFLARGSIKVPSLLAASPTQHGAFGRGLAGQLLIRGEQDVFFSVWLPRAVKMDTPLPLVVFAHDLGGERSDAAPLGNVLAGAGFAVIAADAPFHGLRAGSGDVRSRFTGEARADGFGDAPGDFAGVRDQQGEVVALHPYYYRDAVRQAAVDTMALLRVIRSEAFAKALAALAPELSGLSLDTGHVGYVGIGLGADVGAIVAPFEPDMSALVLAFGGGTGIDGWFASPEQSELAGALLTQLGRPDAVNGGDDPPVLWPDVEVFRTVTDRASPFAYSALLRKLPRNALLLLARDDENVANETTEALASALGAVVTGGEPRHEPALQSRPLEPGASLSANFPAEGGDVTRALFIAEPAAHNALLLEQGTQRYAHPLTPPFARLDDVVVLANPTQSLSDQIGFWFGSVRTCAPTNNVKSPCAATLQRPQAR